MKKLKDRKEIIKGCKETIFRLNFNTLGYGNLSYEVKTEQQAREKLKEVIKENKKYIEKDGYYAEILKSVYVETKEMI